VVFIAVQNLVGISIAVAKICEFQYYASLASKMSIHAPFLGVFAVKIGVIGNFLQFYHSRNAITWDWHLMNQTA